MTELTEGEVLFILIAKVVIVLLFLAGAPMVVINAMQTFGVDVELTWKTWWYASC